ncbi:MAG: cell division protein ZapA [Candidatus Firestonebacteria bacterium]
MEEGKKGVCVDIFGNEYVIKGEGDALHIKDVAKYVDDKMRMISLSTSNVSSSKVAILTALNLTDEIFKLKKEVALYEKNFGKVDELIKTMENQGL